MNPLFIQIENLQNEIELSEKKTFEQSYEEFLQFLEVHDPQLFRRKAKGVRVVPFAMKDFAYRIALDQKND